MVCVQHTFCCQPLSTPPQHPPDTKQKANTMTRAQRRELHEQKRAEKAAARQAAAPPSSTTTTPAKPPAQKQQQQSGVPRSASSSLVNTPTRGLQGGSRGGSQQLQPPNPLGARATDAPPCGVALFSHLPPPKHLDIPLALQRFKGDVHPCIVRLGLEYAAGRIRGADARCVAMLEAFKEVVQVCGWWVGAVCWEGCVCECCLHATTGLPCTRGQDTAA